MATQAARPASGSDPVATRVASDRSASALERGGFLGSDREKGKPLFLGERVERQAGAFRVPWSTEQAPPQRPRGSRSTRAVRKTQILCLLAWKARSPPV